jgi:MFS family permease
LHHVAAAMKRGSENPYEAPGEAAGLRAAGGGFYYGWVMVGVAALAMAATLPGRTHGLGLITLRMLTDLGISRETFALINLAATLIGALFCIPCGWLVDRWGARTLLALVVAALGATVIWMSQLEDATSLAVAVTLSRGVGQSMLSVLSIAILARWFQKRLAPATGLYCVLMSISMAAMTIGVGRLITHFDDWRIPWQYFGYALLAAAPALWLISANDPSNRSREFAAAQPVSRPTDDPGPTWLEALTTPCFWMFSVSISFFGLISAGLTLFQQYVFVERGFGESMFQTVLGVGMLAGMVSNLASGWLGQRVPLPRLLALAMALLALALGSFPFIREAWQVIVYAVVQGLAGGMLTVLFFSVWGKAFGGPQLGRIQGAAQTMTVLASAAGPVCIEWSRAATGSYMQAFLTTALMSIVMAGMAWITPLPCFAPGAKRVAKLGTMEA